VIILLQCPIAILLGLSAKDLMERFAAKAALLHHPFRIAIEQNTDIIRAFIEAVSKVSNSTDGCDRSKSWVGVTVLADLIQQQQRHHNPH
jgi:hypothetical protein